MGLVELVGIEPFSNVEIMEVIDSPKGTMCSKGSNAESAVQTVQK
jgi:hypothetical protein